MTTLAHQTNPVAYTPARSPAVDLRVLALLVRKELREAIQNKWLVLYTLGFCALSLGLASLARSSAGLTGFAGFGKTAASLINLVLILTPLMALTAGAASIAAERERGMLGYLLAQPVTRSEVFFAKFIGLSLAMAASITLGFGVSAVAITSDGAADAWLFVRIALLAVLLAMAMLSVGMLISACTSRAGSASGIAVFAWIAFVLLADVGLMGATVALKLRIEHLFYLSIANPIQAFKMAALQGFSARLDVLGPAGLYAVRSFGDSLQYVLIAAITLWIVLPLIAAWLIFIRKPV